MKIGYFLGTFFPAPGGVQVQTHNIANTIQALSRQSNCKWLIFGWNGRAYNGILFNNPLGWILTNINSNFALFKDNGLMFIKKVLLAIRPSSQDIKEIIETTDKICQFYNASFTLLHVVSDELSDDDIATAMLFKQQQK